MTTSRPQKPSRFIDYFVVCGLDPDSGLEPDKLAGDALHITPLERQYKSKVLAHYPEKVPWNIFDQNAIGMLCMPRGLGFKTQKNCLKPTFHTFIITREDGSRMYGAGLTFYEEVHDKKICGAMQTLQAMYLTDVSSISTANPIISVQDQNVSRSLPRSFKLASHAATSFYDVAKDTLFATKCIAVILPLPYVVVCKKFLTSLYQMAVVRTDPPLLNIESYISNLLYEVPIPEPKMTVKFYCIDKEFVCRRPGPDELPLIDYPLRELFSCIGVDAVVDILSSILQENQVLLYSSDYYKLMLVAESLSAFLFPFSWQHVYVPILPASLHNFLDAPVPYIMGLIHGPEDRSSLQLPGEANLCFVDIDKQFVELPEDIVQFPYKQDFVKEISECLIKNGIKNKAMKVVGSPKPTVKNLNERAIHGLRYANMTSTGSLPRRKDKRAQWNYDSDSGLSSGSNESGFSSSNVSITANLPMAPADVLQRSEAFQRVSAIAKKTGVISSYEDLQKYPRQHMSMDSEGNTAVSKIPSAGEHTLKQYIQDLSLNNTIQEIFLNRFIHMFSSYEQFVIQPNQDMDQWLSQRESMQNFDKTAFLSDQPEPHLPFLSRFLETQMFASLIDNKVLSLWEDPDPSLQVFDSRIKLSRERHGDSLVRTPTYEVCNFLNGTQTVDSKMSSTDIRSPAAQSLDLPIKPSETHRPGYWPKLDGIALNREPTHSKLRKWPHNNRKWKQAVDKHREKNILDMRSKGVRLSSMSPAVIAQTNWKFVEALLKECKMKTKRMLVEKMGQEAVELGHGEISITGLEENTLIASLCDLLERVWSHGLLVKESKSALWSHLLSYQAKEDRLNSQKANPNELRAPVVPLSSKNFRLPEFILSLKTGALTSIAAQISNFDLTSMSLEPESPSRGRERERRDKMSRSPHQSENIQGIKPLPLSISFDMRNVQAMTEIRSDIGYARAWVRLSLEKQILSKHLKKLLSDTDLLRGRYKRYAFLRCDEEKEQFLYHLLSLNAVDYFCFTNTFHTTIIPYRVIVFPSRKLSASTTSAQAYVQVSGSRGETSIVNIPKQQLQLVFQHRNLGLLTTLRIGHDNTGISPKWMIEHVLVRNEVTGHTYKFPCGRWLGKGVDDGSSERLLIGELVPSTTDSEELVQSCRTPPRCRSPNVPRQPTEPKLTIPEIQQMLGDAVNNIVKYYYKPEKERGSLTVLLCGEMGIVYCLEQVFLYGFKSTRFFKQIYLWDYFLKVDAYFDSLLQEEIDCDEDFVETEEQAFIMSSYCNLVNKVNDSSNTMGKDGKFQMFICLAARDHLLHRMMYHIATSPITAQMYHEQSFLRDQSLVEFLMQILETLSEFDIILEASLTKGMNNQ